MDNELAEIDGRRTAATDGQSILVRRARDRTSTREMLKAAPRVAMANGFALLCFGDRERKKG